VFFWFIRGVSILLVISLILFIGYLHTGRPVNPFPEEGDYPYYASRSCKKCHEEIYKEWESSFHAQSWNDPLVQNLSNNFKNADCIPCHAPQPLLLTMSEGSTPIPRKKMRKTGVNCLSCHRIKQGVASSSILKAEPCRPFQDNRISDIKLCQSCHNLHGTVDVWKATPLYAEKRDCLSCHMPFVPKKGGSKRRSHKWPGGHDQNMISHAVKLNASVVSQKLIVDIHNTGAGHNIPTELRHRALILQVTIKSGWFVKETYEHVFRNPYKGENKPNAQLKFNEKRTFTFPLPSGEGEAHIRLVYKLMPKGQGSAEKEIKKITIGFKKRSNE